MPKKYFKKLVLNINLMYIAPVKSYYYILAHRYMRKPYTSPFVFVLTFLSFFTFDSYANFSFSDSTKLVLKTEKETHSNYPVCESDFRFEVFKVSRNQVIVKVNREANTDLFRYEILFEGFDKEGDATAVSNSITFGKTLSISGIDANLPYKVSIKRVCFFNEFEVEGTTLTFENSPGTRDLILGVDCNQFNGGGLEQNGTQSDWLLFPGTLTSNSDQLHLRITITPCDNRDFPISVIFSNYSDTIDIGSYLDSLSIEACGIMSTLLWGYSSLYGYADSCGPITLFEMNNPVLSCEDTTTLTPSNSTIPLSTLSIDDIFYINVGFPVKVVTVEGGSGEFRGTGELILPFTSKKLKVQFGGKINTLMWMWEGEVFQLNQEGFDYSGNASFGSLACYKSDDEWDKNGNHKLTGEPWDPRGFGQNGQYSIVPPYPGYQDGDPFDPNYDPCGFDVEGIHFETDSIYNPAGCSRDSIDRDNKSCVPCSAPYYWLNPNSPPSAAGIELANMYADSLIPIITLHLNTLKSANTSAKTSVQDSINTIKTSILGLTSTAGLNNSFLFGANNEYISVGCSKLFTSKPQKYSVNDYRRDSTIIQIEDKHVTIYEKDERLSIYLRKDSIITSELLQAKLLISKDEILYLIRRLQPDSIAHYSSNSNAFKAWVNLTMNDKLNDLFDGIYSPWPVDDNFSSNTSTFRKKLQAIESEASEEKRTDITLSDLENSSNIGNYDSGTSLQIESTPIPFNRINSKNLDKFDNYRDISNRSYSDIELKALALEQKIRFKADQVASRSSGDAIDAPFSITNSVEGSIYDIILDDILITPSNASLSAYCVINDANSGNKIVFGSQDVGFNINGFTDPIVTINLFSDVQFKLLNTAQIKILGGSGTYVNFNCAGYLGCGIDAQIEFCPNYLAPVDTTTMTIIQSDTARVRAGFSVEMQKWGQFVTTVSIEPFAVVDAPNLVWRINAATLDFSDAITPAIIFPENYNHPLVQNQVASPHWKGFHLRELRVDVLEKFGDENASNLSISVENMIIDDVGFTGRFLVGGNIISLETGNLGGWAFSVDTIEISIIANRLDGGGMSGLLHVPLFKQNEGNPAVNVNDCVRYRAYYQKDRSLVFSVSPLANYKVPLWKADLTLSSETVISVKIEGGDVDIVANLTGGLTIKGNINNSQDTIPDLAFENVLIRNKFPYIAGGTFKVSTGGLSAKVQGFTFSLSRVGLTIPGEGQNNDIKLELIAGISLSDDDLSLTAQGWMEFTGNVTILNGKQVFQYTGFDLKGFYIETKVKDIFELKGGLIIYKNDTNWGTGFKGLISVKVESIKAEMSAVAFFGKKDGLKYFFVDMLFISDVGVPMGPLTMNGIGGGVYYHVSRVNNNLYTLPTSYSPPSSMEGMANGSSLSGIQYQFNPNVLIGFKTTIYVSSTDGKAFNGSASFEIVFNSQEGNPNKIGGLQAIYMQGTLNLMHIKELSMVPNYTALNSSSSAPTSAPMNAYLDIKLDFKNRVYDGQLAVFLNAGLLKGVGTGGKLGLAKIHFSPQKWYIHIGTPTDKFGLSLSLPGVQNLAQVSGYFAIGTDVPDIPALPAKFSRFNSQLGTLNNIRSSGKGFAFGASLEVNTGNKTFLCFYANFAMGLGFDVMVKDYGDAYCSNTNETLGINGWYATGQIWAYVEGEMGIIFGGKQYHLFKMGAQAALQAQLPNPFYARGTVGGRYSILGGLVKGEANFDFELGEKCIIQGASASTDSDLILSTYPSKNSDGVEVEANASVTLAVPVNTNFDLQGQTVRLDLSNLYVKSEDYTISGKTEIRDDKMHVQFIPDYMLPPNAELKFIYEFKEYAQGVFQRMVFDTIEFTTGNLPDILSGSNITASYPIDNMMNFFKHEFSNRKGYIILEKSQAYLFNSDGDSKPYFRLIRPDNTFVILPHSLMDGRTILFDLPDEFLSNSTFYKIQLVKKEGTINNYPVGGAMIASFPTPSYVPPFQPQANSINPNDKFKILFEVNFRTSQFNTLKAKMEFLKNNKQSGLNSNAWDDNVYQTTNGAEPFDRFDLGEGGMESLVQLESRVQSSQLEGCSGGTCWPIEFVNYLPIEFPGTDSWYLVGETDCGYIDCSKLITSSPKIFSNISNLDDRFKTNNFSGVSTSLTYNGVASIKQAFNNLKYSIDGMGGNQDPYGNMILGFNGDQLFQYIYQTYDPNLSMFKAGHKNAKLTVSYHLPGLASPSSVFDIIIE